MRKSKGSSHLASASKRAELSKYKSRLKLADESLRSAWRKQAESQKRWDAINQMAVEVKKNAEVLYSEIDETGKAYSTLQEQHAEMQQQLSEQNAELTKARSQKEKFRQYNQGMLRKQQGMRQRLEAASANIQQLKAQVSNLKQDINTRSKGAQAEKMKMLQLQRALDAEKTEHAMLKASKQYRADMSWIHQKSKQDRLQKQEHEHRENMDDLRARLSTAQKKNQKLKKMKGHFESTLQQLKNKMKCEVKILLCLFHTIFECVSSMHEHTYCHPHANIVPVHILDSLESGAIEHRLSFR